MYTGSQIREMFLKYFEGKGHTIVSSSSLVPHDDPTLLFTNAGMNQFKDVFLGLDKRPYNKATTSQKCVRAGGKHNDLDTVGRTARHHTFFEMLGNFSFGDYFKTDAIKYAWEFLTEVLKLDKNTLYITIYKDDDEAGAIWQDIAGVPAEKIIRLGEKDNFWSMGDTGPCGPCSEILVDRGEHLKCKADICAIGECDCDRWLEIWNLVFMQFNRDEKGNMTPLPKPSIDTGMGLERITSIMQNANSNYDTDLINEVIRAVEKMCGQSYNKDDRGFPFRVIADHARACTFLVSDGVMPSNDGRGYVLRRILRRAVRFGKVLGINDTFMYNLVPVVVQIMGKAYPEIAEKQDYVQQVIRIEEERFHLTLNEGMKIVDEIVKKVKSNGENVINGHDAFVLYDTYGFPMDLTEDIAEENNLTVDRAGFEKAMSDQRERARAARQETGAVSQLQELYGTIGKRFGPTKFLGYNDLEIKGKLIALIDGEKEINLTKAGDEVQIILDNTPFYGESGGQIGDSGQLVFAKGKVEVTDTKKIFNGLFIHIGKVIEGVIEVNNECSAIVNEDRRKDIARNHSATHLLHKALKTVLGEHVNQAGSLVEDDKLRFDFTHFTKVSDDELKKVEELVNTEILNGLAVNISEMSIEEAKVMGATALFGEKYGDFVRVVKMGEFSTELCGGCHIHSTGEIGLFRLVSEGGVGAGLRRIEAVSGRGALKYIDQKDKELKDIADLVKAQSSEVLKRIESIVISLKEKEKEVENLQTQLAKYEVQDLLEQVENIQGIKVLAQQVNVPDMEALRNMGDMFKDKMGSGVVVLGAAHDDKVSFVAMVTKDLLSRGLHAGNIVKEVAKVAGGGGGGRPDMAQAGGKIPEKIKDALDSVGKLVNGQLIG